jgi:hypothetical protein
MVIPMKDLNNLTKEVLTGAVTGTALGLVGFWLVDVPSTHAMGIAMFILTPFAAGFAIALVTRNQSSKMIAATVLALIASMAILVSLGLETILCAITAFPVLLGAVLTGVLLGWVFRKLVAGSASNDVKFTSIALLSLPLLIFAGHRMEMSTLIRSRQEVVTTSVRLSAEPTVVWASLQSFDSVQADKSFLMYFGLPIPNRCTMDGSGLGATRTCYFNKGFIKETVTKWVPPSVMGLSIDRTNLPGRRWLGFESASYELRSEGTGTILTRTTIITSHLYPEFYWRPFERWGVRSEHQYIFDDLKRRLK